MHAAARAAACSSSFLTGRKGKRLPSGWHEMPILWAGLGWVHQGTQALSTTQTTDESQKSRAAGRSVRARLRMGHNQPPLQPCTCCMLQQGGGESFEHMHACMQRGGTRFG